MENEILELKKRVEALEKRNLKVESDKAWETSTFRIFSVIVITYVIASVVMYYIGVKNYWVSALVPTVGFFLSTQTLPALKRWWIKKYYGRPETTRII